MLRLPRWNSFTRPLSCLLTGCFLFLFAGPIHADDGYQIGLIDMAHVFKEYKKFVYLTERLQEEVRRSDELLAPKIENIQAIQAKMKELAPTSAEYEALESEFLTAQADLKKAQLQKQRELMKKETEVYKGIYLEVSDAVERYSKYYKYTQILRFNRSVVDAADNPQEVMEGMNRQVLYHQNRDDLTDPVLNYLNDRWEKQQNASAPASQTTR